MTNEITIQVGPEGMNPNDPRWQDALLTMTGRVQNFPFWDYKPELIRGGRRLDRFVDPHLEALREWRRMLWHNVAGHLIGYCVVFPFSRRLGHWIHDRTEP